MEITQPPITDVIPRTVLTAQGDIIVRGAGDPERLAIGAARQMLKVNAGATALEYTNLQTQFLKCFVDKVGASQAIPGTVFTKVSFDTVIFDPSAIFVDATDRILPTVAGYYVVIAHVAWSFQTVAGNVYLDIYVNGVSYQRSSMKNLDTGSLAQSMQVPALVYFDGVDDYVEVFVYHNANVPAPVLLNTNKGTCLQVLGPF